MKKQVVRISVLQSSKIVTALYAFFGCLYTLIGIPMVVFGNAEIKVIGVMYIIAPVFMAIIGFIFFVIFAAIYNLLASWLGGIEVEVENIEDGF